MFISEDSIIKAGGTPTSTAVLDQSDLSVFHKECASCGRIKPFNQFKRDSSFKEGVRDQCEVCEATPRLSTAEHTARLRESNYYSEEHRKQRWGRDQLDFIDDFARLSGKWMHYSEFIYLLKKALPGKLYFVDGNIAGDISVFRIFGAPQPEDGRDFHYQWYISSGWMPEYSTYFFSEYDVPIKESRRGFRTPLLRLIRSGLLSEERCAKIFGEPSSCADTVWRRSLYRYRNQTD